MSAPGFSTLQIDAETLVTQLQSPTVDLPTLQDTAALQGLVDVLADALVRSRREHDAYAEAEHALLGDHLVSIRVQWRSNGYRIPPEVDWQRYRGMKVGPGVGVVAIPVPIAIAKQL